MNLSLIALQAIGLPLSDRLNYSWETSHGATKWIIGIVVFLVLRAAFQWAVGITKISRYQRESNALLSQQNQLLQRQIELLERFGGK